MTYIEIKNLIAIIKWSGVTMLNLLVSLNGVEYYNLIDGANAVNFKTQRPALEVGDILDILAK